MKQYQYLGTEHTEMQQRDRLSAGLGHFALHLRDTSQINSMPLATAANSDSDTHLAQKYHVRATLPHSSCVILKDLAPERYHLPPGAQPLSFLRGTSPGTMQRTLLMHSDRKEASRLHPHVTVACVTLATE